MVYKPDVKKGLELFVDAEFAGNWKNADANHPNSIFLISCMHQIFNFLSKTEIENRPTVCTAGGRVARFSLPDRPAIHRAAWTQPAHVNISFSL